MKNGKRKGAGGRPRIFTGDGFRLETTVSAPDHAWFTSVKPIGMSRADFLRKLVCFSRKFFEDYPNALKDI